MAILWQSLQCRHGLEERLSRWLEYSSTLLLHCFILALEDRGQSAFLPIARACGADRAVSLVSAHRGVLPYTCAGGLGVVCKQDYGQPFGGVSLTFVIHHFPNLGAVEPTDGVAVIWTAVCSSGPLVATEVGLGQRLGARNELVMLSGWLIILAGAGDSLHIAVSNPASVCGLLGDVVMAGLAARQVLA